MGSQNVSFIWDGHHRTLIGVFQKLLESSSLVDCTITAEGQKFKVHKEVLSAFSPYFELLLKEENEKNPNIILSGVTLQELRAIIDFMYNGKVTISEHKIEGLINTAQSLQIKGFGNKKAVSENREEVFHSKISHSSCISHRQKRKAGEKTSVGQVSPLVIQTSNADQNNSSNSHSQRSSGLSLFHSEQTVSLDTDTEEVIVLAESVIKIEPGPGLVEDKHLVASKTRETKDVMPCKRSRTGCERAEYTEHGLRKVGSVSKKETPKKHDAQKPPPPTMRSPLSVQSTLPETFVLNRKPFHASFPRKESSSNVTNTFSSCVGPLVQPTETQDPLGVTKDMIMLSESTVEKKSLPEGKTLSVEQDCVVVIKKLEIQDVHSCKRNRDNSEKTEQTEDIVSKDTCVSREEISAEVTSPEVGVLTSKVFHASDPKRELSGSDEELSSLAHPMTSPSETQDEPVLTELPLKEKQITKQKKYETEKEYFTEGITEEDKAGSNNEHEMKSVPVSKGTRLCLGTAARVSKEASQDTISSRQGARASVQGTDTSGSSGMKRVLRRSASTSPLKKHCCPHCHKAFKHIVDLRVHIQSHSGEKTHKCLECDYVTNKIQLLKRHHLTHSTLLKCTECDFTTKKNFLLKIHQHSHSSRKPFQCTKCDFTGSQSSDLKMHKCLHTEKILYRCTKCSFSSQNGDFKKHKCIRSGKRFFRCTECSFASVQKVELMEHQSTHTGKKPSKSMKGDYSAMQSSHLKVNMRSHTRGTPLKCSECNFSTIWKQNLFAHQRIHTGEKPFKCSECDFKAMRGSQLKIHMRIHTGETPFKCSECDYSAVWKSNLLMHQRIHTGEKPFKCTDCGYAAIQLSTLNNHRRIHTGEKPFKCEKCNFQSSWQSDMRRHILVQHNLKKVSNSI